MWGIISIFIASVILLSYLLEHYLQRKRSFWIGQGVHVFKNDLTLFQLLRGKLPAIFDHEHYKELETLKLPYGGRSELGTPVFVVRDLELVKLILVKDFDYFIDRRSFGGDDPIFSNSVLFMEGQAWRNMRAALSPTFSSGKIRRMFEQFDASGQKLVDYVKRNCPKATPSGYDVNLDEILRRYTVDVIGSVAFGMDTKALSEKESDFLKYSTKSSKIDVIRLIRTVLITSLPKFSKLLKLQFLDAESADFFKSIITSAIKMRETSGENRNDFLQLLLEARKLSSKHDENEPSAETYVHFSDTVVISQAFTFFFAGFETTTNALRNMMYLLSAHPEVQDKLRAEINEKAKQTNGEITYDSINAMEYMDMVVSEALRYCSPGTRLERKCVRDYQIPGQNVVIPKNSVVAIPVIGFHKDPEIYSNPDEFNPENFSPEQKSARSPFTFMSFGQGPRNCIGMRFALMETKAATAHILRKFKILPSEKFPLPLKWDRSLGIEASRKDTIVRLVPCEE